MINSWYPINIQLDSDTQFSCLAVERTLEKAPSDTLNHSFIDRFYNTVYRWLKAPGSYAFGMFMRRDNPYPGTFQEYEQTKASLQWTYAQNAVGGLVSLGLFSPLYVLAETFKATVLQHKDQGFEYLHNPVKSAELPALTVLSRNTALLSESLQGKFNMRPNAERVLELADGFLKPLDPNDTPSVLCLQEVYCEDSSDTLAEKLKSRFPYIVHKVATRTFGMSSGLFLASQYPILCSQFIQFPKSWFLTDGSLMGRFNVDVFTNKGVLMSALHVGDEICIVVNSHTQSRIGLNEIETKSYEATRTQQLQIITQGTLDFADDVEEKYGSVSKIIMAGDFNCTDVYDDGTRTVERTKNHFFFQDLFNGPELETWFKCANLFKAHPHDQWPREEEGKDSHAVRPFVHYDHVGLLYLKDLEEDNETSVFFDQGYSKDMPTRSSDHAGILLKNRKV